MLLVVFSYLKHIMNKHSLSKHSFPKPRDRTNSSPIPLSGVSMFDSSKEVEVAIPSPGGMKNVVVNYPADELIIKRAAMLKTIVSSLGRGKTKTDPMNNAELIDAELLAKIKVSGDDDLDAYEAQRLVN